MGNSNKNERNEKGIVMTLSEKIAMSVLFTTIIMMVTAWPVVTSNRLRLGILIVSFITMMFILSFVKTKEGSKQ